MSGERINSVSSLIGNVKNAIGNKINLFGKSFLSGLNTVKNILYDKIKSVGSNFISKIKSLKDNLTNKYYCNIDSDCISETCCHATSCINKQFRPNCNFISCTEECAPNTMDCNQGSCQCTNHRCKAVINSNNSA